MFSALYCLFFLVVLAVTVEATRESGLSLWPRTYVCVFASVVTAYVIAYLLSKLITY